MMFNALIFDLDGTLLNTLEDIASSGNTVLARHGFPGHDLDDYRYFVGEGSAMLVERMLPAGKRDDNSVKLYLGEYSEEYSRNWNMTTKPYDGVPEVLDGLKALGLKLAVLSNKQDEDTKKCVTEFLPDGSFDIVMGYNGAIPHKPDPTGALQIADLLNVVPEQILYVGDTAIDMKTAVAAGMFPVGAVWGFRSSQELKDNGAQILIERPQEILRLLDDLSLCK